ncbi:hypothetical protein KSC_024480 [Ktedonobacter sp. SOSP1-52]|uniref:GNAT family N-acetyltransferase n=1 Tax=Ktedonobacter sp. SOSP1-52 TaxID=2778366 RepID=UPI001915D84A|nr:hypothetical protein KSC_024480 [Ktedonobacter sp. SOSP1-52]
MSLQVYLWLLSFSLALAPSPLGPFFSHSEPFGPLFIYQQQSLKSDENGVRQAYGFTQLYPSFSSVSLKPLWILNDLFVIQGARHSGIGKALLDRAREFAVETQARGLTLKTAVNNSDAQTLYEVAGWQKDRQLYSYNLYL